MATLKELIDDSLNELGFLISAQYAGSTNEDDLQAFAIAKAVVRELREERWQALISEATFTLTSATEYNVSSDFLAFAPNTMFEDGSTYPNRFPTNATDWAYAKSTNASPGISHLIRYFGNKLQVHQPSTGEEIRYEYYSSHLVQATAGGSTKETFTADNDVWLLDDGLFNLSFNWRFLRSKEMDWQSYQTEAAILKNKILGRDKGSRTIRFGGQPEPRYEPNAETYVQ